MTLRTASSTNRRCGARWPRRRPGTKAEDALPGHDEPRVADPPQSIIGYADFLLEPRSDPLTRQQREDVVAITRGAHRMAALIEQLLGGFADGGWPRPRFIPRGSTRADHRHGGAELAPEIARKGLRVSCDLPAPAPRVPGNASTSTRS